jgi:predicted Fe-S protein YdhL (DUF1289 family)
MEPDVESPCIGICTIIDTGLEDVCAGCGRTTEEIEQWPFATDTTKKEVKAKALHRLESI